jgi:hypothetical protein
MNRTLETAIIVTRGDRRQAVAAVGDIGTDQRVPVDVDIEASPPPQPDGQFYAMGRDSAHVWPRTPSPVNHHLGILDIQSHQAPWFLFPKVPGAMVINQGFGAQLPVSPRPNIDAPGAGTYGQLAALRTDQTLGSFRYLKIMG